MTASKPPRAIPRDAKRILVVDDEPRMIGFIRMNLELEGYQVIEAHTGLEALEMVRTQLPDLILLDVMMPRMSGFQVCSRLKSDPTLRDIPVVMVTALNEVADVERAVESGADDFLTKPVHRIELVTRVKSLLRVRLLKKQLEKTLREVEKLTDGEG